MVNVPPPLVCSTPPPIDFGEDDDDSGLQSTLHLEDGDADEYSEYGLVTESREATLNAKVPSLTELPISTEQKPELINGHNKSTATAKQTVEAFNYQVKAPEIDTYEQEVPPPFPEGDQQNLGDEEQSDQEAEEEEEVEANTNDNLPSLKLDSLSLYSSESLSLSTGADEQATKATGLCHQVTLEDVTDDSDEECSPKKPKELFIPEGADDFFAIEIVASPTLQQVPPLSNQIPIVEHNFNAFQETPPSVDLLQPETTVNVQVEDGDEDDDFGDFGDFADFAAAPAPVESQKPKPVISNNDGFDDFQDFTTPTTTTVKDEDDDDDFGDFSEPSFVSAEAAPAIVATPVLPQPPPPAAVHLSITERVKPVLDLMFPNQEESCALNATKQTPLAKVQSLHFGAIEQAHALDYQWVTSEMRHSLVRSLGIDSRNILFGDKWNASMPRFAANLSYDPLKPLKPLSTAPNVDSTSSWQPTNNNNNSTLQTLDGLEAAAATVPTTVSTAATSQASQVKTQPGLALGEGQSSTNDSNTIDETFAIAMSATTVHDTAATTSVFAAATTTATISPTLSADGNGHNFDDSEQLSQQQQLDLRSSSPSPPPSAASATTAAVTSQQLHEVSSSSNSYALPLKETHIYTPSKSDTVVAKTTTLTPIDFDYEIASAGIIIDETVVKKEYRDVEYKPPPFGLDSPNKLNALGKASTEDDDFSDFQSVSAIKNSSQLQPPRNGTPTFGEQMILSPAILLPQSIPLAKPSIEWGDNALASINAEELARIEELFSHQSKPPTISATVAQQSPKQQHQQKQQQQQQQHHQQEDDEWSDFVSVPVQQHQQHQQHQQQVQQNNHNNNVVNMQKPPSAIVAAAKEDDWSDFVSSTPLSATLNSRAAPQFNSGAWQSANFYNNPMSLYQQQQQPHGHSNLVPKYHSNKNNTSTNNNNNNNVAAMPQQIHMMHDFSTAPTATPLTAPATYQQQHHQHHQQQLQQQLQQQQQQQQHRQQFHLGNAKVAPRISLIPDLSFVAPALPTNAGAFMSSLPKPSFSAKK